MGLDAWKNKWFSKAEDRTEGELWLVTEAMIGQNQAARGTLETQTDFVLINYLGNRVKQQTQSLNSSTSEARIDRTIWPDTKSEQQWRWNAVNGDDMAYTEHSSLSEAAGDERRICRGVSSNATDMNADK